MKFNNIYPRDMIALLTLVGSFWLLSRGIDSYFTGIVAVIIGYYFSKRVYEENHIKKK